MLSEEERACIYVTNKEETSCIMIVHITFNLDLF